MGSVLESRESSKNEDGKTDAIYKTMYANGAVALKVRQLRVLSTQNAELRKARRLWYN